MQDLAEVIEQTYEAEYVLESPLGCPKCQAEISSLRVVRLLRGKVNFTSTLPRKGYVVLCPECMGVISATLGGI
jgi:hypothetical protein